tara:strand:+ start:602 stop:745 length:144 start_codon:yes stop_codon:yes gene_type:complete
MNQKMNQKEINTKAKKSNNTPSENNINQQNNNYPKDIQGLFERLGIE